MQQFRAELKNTPMGASLAHCSVSSGLNREDTLSVQNSVSKLTLNNPEGNQSESNRKQNLRVSVKVYVLNQRGEPLMPCSPRKAKVLLKHGKAIVVRRSPFTIQLTIATGESKQDITLGIDTGYENVGVSAVTEKEELLSATFILRTNISNLLKEKAMYRKNRRNRLWYRKPRWNNRKKIELAPSVLHKINTHISIIEKIKKLLPITKIILETGLFDPHKLKNKNISGKNYQNGDMYGFENVKSYVLSRDNHICFFNTNKCSNKLEVHHIKFRSSGGSDNPNNLITLCTTCHKKVHDNKLSLNIKKHKELKSATIMNVIRKRLLEFYLDAVETFGYETKVKRRNLDLEKSHSNDAFVIAGGKYQVRSKEFEVIQKRKNNRCLQLNRKGYKPSIKKDRSKIQPFDLFWVNSKQYVCKGMFNYGKYICYGSTKLKEYFKTKDIEKYYNQGGLVWN